MKTVSLYQEFDVSVYEAETWEYGTHRHSFFEIVYILSGKGTHILNGENYPYSENSLFILTPSDTHSFNIASKTAFCIVTFNKIYFSKEKSSQGELIDFSELFKKIEFILYNSDHLRHHFFTDHSDLYFVQSLIHRLVFEIREKGMFYESVIQNSVVLLLSLLARNVQKSLATHSKQVPAESAIGEILLYIQQNIYQNDKLKIENLADRFAKSKNHLNVYFKAETGDTIKDYIITYKLALVKVRLLHSDLTVSQIAHELGFTDESHLNKLFKGRFQQTAKEYRKKHVSIG
ncbi:MAG: AraC family transcriptional regulator [Cyclobacteriaceae bacterium]|jgi:AraC family L-rhamnose operon regulatory protein RhaS